MPRRDRDFHHLRKSHALSMKMLNQEPTLSVGIYEGRPQAQGAMAGLFSINGSTPMQGEFRVEIASNQLALFEANSNTIAHSSEIVCTPLASGTFTLSGSHHRGEIPLGAEGRSNL
jgi:hypothetical protein